jgi:uncharacterized membrane protein
MDHSNLLRQIPLFESMEEADLVALGNRLTEKSFAVGDVIFSQGEKGDAMYLIRDGAVDIVAGADGKRVNLASLFTGQYFGELSLLDGAPRSATALAARPTEALELERDDFIDFIKRRPEASLSIMHELGERMRATNELMTRTVTRNVVEEEEGKLSLGDRIADQVAAFGGSWPFIFTFSGFMAVWMVFNSVSGKLAFDPLPFMFLNLFLSTIAALQAPVIMMSQNRQDKKDRVRSEMDFDVNRRAEAEIQGLAQKLHRLDDKIDDIEELLRTGLQTKTG